MKTEILEKTFDTIRPNGQEFAKSFYQNLFIKYPEVEPLFDNVALEQQEKKLLLSLVLVVDNLKNFTYLKNMLRNLGERHLQYDVISDHYPLVGELLLETLEQYLGSDWTAEAKQAWTEAYGVMVNLMLEGAKDQSPSLSFYHTELNSNVMERLRIEVLARKYLRNG
uniref:globin domain-containing protein n=1 Tax=Anaplasma marginale TaxID=770 RepID=UPI0018E9EF28